METGSIARCRGNYVRLATQMNFRTLNPNGWFADFPVPANDRDRQKVATLLIFFRSTGIFTLLCLVFGAFVWANPFDAAAFLLLLNLSVLAVPYALLRMGRPRAAAIVFTIGFAILAQGLVLFSGGLRSPVLYDIFPIVFAAGLLLGNRAAILVSVFAIAADAAAFFYTSSGGAVPAIFPMPAQAALFTLAFNLIYVLPPLLDAIERHRAANVHIKVQLDTQNEAREELAYHVQLLEQVPDPVISTDKQHRIVFWNRAAELAFGIDRKKAVGSDVMELIGSIDPMWQTACDYANENGEWHGELSTMSAGGGIATLEASVRNLVDRGGTVVGRVEAFRDITAAKAADLALRKSEQRLRTVTDTAPVGILLLDRENRSVFGNRFVNELLLAQNQWNGGEATGPHAAYGITLSKTDGSPLDVTEFPSSHVRRTGQPVQDFRVRATNTADETGYFSISAAPVFGDDGTVEYVVVILDDISEQFKLQEQYLHVQKMESIGALAGGIAHDFNNLLLVINGYCDRMLEGMATDAPLRNDIQSILFAGHRAADLTSHLLAFSRKQIISPRPFSLDETIRQSKSILHGALRDNVRLELHLQAADSCILADPGQINQILMNLAINAQEAMPEGGRIRIGTTRIAVPYSNDQGPFGHCVQLDVEDNGHGIPVGAQPRIFEPFFSTKSQELNAGLGLSTVYGIVKQSGGSISVVSSPSQGTRFRILLPETDLRPEIALVQREVPKSSGGTILVVEDREEVREFLTTCLREEGYEILEAASGEMALRVVAEYTGKINLLLSDMIMPGMTGKQLALRLREMLPTINVILMTGYSEELLEKAASSSLWFDVLRKPFTPALLLEKLQTLFANPSAMK